MVRTVAALCGPLRKAAALTHTAPTPTHTHTHTVRPAERKTKLREAQAEVKREVEAYRAQRDARLRAPQPGAAALDAKIGRITAEVDRAIAGLEAEYQANKGLAIETILKVRGPGGPSPRRVPHGPSANARARTPLCPLPPADCHQHREEPLCWQVRKRPPLLLPLIPCRL
jgi:hypothetical protein